MALKFTTIHKHLVEVSWNGNFMGEIYRQSRNEKQYYYIPHAYADRTAYTLNASELEQVLSKVREMNAIRKPRRTKS